MCWDKRSSHSLYHINSGAAGIVIIRQFQPPTVIWCHLIKNPVSSRNRVFNQEYLSVRIGINGLKPIPAIWVQMNHLVTP